MQMLQIFNEFAWFVHMGILDEVKKKKIQGVCWTTIERLRFTFTPNGKREFAPRDQVSPLFFVYRLLLLHKNK